MISKRIVIVFSIILMVPFLISYSPELAIRRDVFFRYDPVSAFTFEVTKACCSDPNRDPIYVIQSTNPNVAISLERSIFGNWIVPDLPDNE